MLSGARTTRALMSCCFISSRTRSSFALSIGHGIDLFVRRLLLALLLQLPRTLFTFDHAIERSVQRSAQTSARRLAGNGPAQEVNFRAQTVPDIIKHRGRVICL